MSSGSGALSADVPRPAGLPGKAQPRPMPLPRVRGLLGEIASMVRFFAVVCRAAVTRPINWPAEFVEQSWILVRRCTAPLALAVMAFGFGTIGTQAGQIFAALGATDRLGQTFVTGSVRELGGWATAMIVAGVGGTAICADLGARKVREELDALAVVGVNPIRALVVPRMLALIVITPLLFMVAVFFCTLSGVLVALTQYDITLSAFAATFTANFSTPELLGAVIKSCTFGVIIGTVCCYKGLTCSGGAQGVGRAVNQAVVISFVVLWIFNYAFTSVLLAGFPAMQGLR